MMIFLLPVSLPSPSWLTNLKILAMGEFVCTLKKAYQLEKGMLPEAIVAEIKLNRKKIFFVLSYCHPNLSNREYEEHINSLEHIYGCISKENPAVTIIT